MNDKESKHRAAAEAIVNSGMNRVEYMRKMMGGAAKDRSEIRARLAIAKAQAKKGPDADPQTDKKAPA